MHKLLKLKRFLILLAVFVGVAAATFFVINYESAQESYEMSDASLPVVYALCEGEQINALYGNAQEMEAVSMRDTITPADENYTVKFLVDTQGTAVTSASYELLTLNGEKTVAGGEAVLEEKGKENYKITIRPGGSLVKETDYLLVLTLETGAGTAYYYTRTAYFPDSYFDTCLAFAGDLHAEITGEKETELLTTALETDGSTEDSYYHTTITSSAEQVCMTDFAYTVVSDPLISVEELTNSYTSLRYTYKIMHEEEDTVYYYRVTEFYRVRTDGDSCYLLDFDKTVSGYFNPYGTKEEDYLDLGICSSEVSCVSSESGSIAAFVQEGELWLYNIDSNTYTCIFTFLEESGDAQSGEDSSAGSGSGSDIRCENDAHDIRILQVDETGDMDFAVYGYMNRGDYEGETAVILYHYTYSSNTIEEIVSLSLDRSYAQTRDVIGEILYLSEDGIFYLGSDSGICAVDTDTKEVSAFLSDMNGDTRVVSEDGSRVAWTAASEGDEARVLYITDLESGQTLTTETAKKRYLRPLGFYGTDCIYGIASASDLEEASGLFVMDTIKIVDTTDEALAVLKKYEKDGIRFTGLRSAESGMIELIAVTNEDGTYTETEDVLIQSSSVEEDPLISISYIENTYGLYDVVLKLSSEVKSSAASVRATQITQPFELTEGGALKSEQFVRSYYVYALGGVLLATDDAAEAVQTADENGGVVTDSSQNYIWNRAKMLSQGKITLQSGSGSTAEVTGINTMLSAMGAHASGTAKKLKKGMTAYEILKEQEGDGILLDLTGCTLSQMLYYVGRGYPVYTLLEEDHPVLISGYTTELVWYFDPVDGTVISMSQEDAEALFAQTGNVFYAYQIQK